jgi:ribonuclease-3
VIDRPGWASARLGYRFSDESLLDQALTHRSASGLNNERLEFLGDAVLGAVISRELFQRRPQAGEGILSRLRARLVRKDTLAALAQEVELGGWIRLGSGEMRAGGQQRASILANALEAVCGAIYLDGGMAAAERVILALYAKRLRDLPHEDALADPKTRLQEWLQARGHSPPTYRINAVTGKAHAQTFEVMCVIDALGVQAAGHGGSRRLAEQEAAAHALTALEGG